MLVPFWDMCFYQSFYEQFYGICSQNKTHWNWRKLLCRNSKTDSHLAVRSAIRVPRGFRPELALFSLANGILRRASPLDGDFALSDLCNSFPILPIEPKGGSQGMMWWYYYIQSPSKKVCLKSCAGFFLWNKILRFWTLDGDFAPSDLCNSFPILTEKVKKPGDDVMIVLHPKSL